MLLSALTPFWLPHALRELGNSTPEDLREAALFAIHQLQQQIYFLAQSFGLEQELIPTPQQKNGNGIQPKATLSSIPDAGSTALEAAPGPVPSPEEIALLYQDDDALIGKMFNF